MISMKKIMLLYVLLSNLVGGIQALEYIEDLEVYNEQNSPIRIDFQNENKNFLEQYNEGNTLTKAAIICRALQQMPLHQPAINRNFWIEIIDNLIKNENNLGDVLSQKVRLTLRKQNEEFFKKDGVDRWFIWHVETSPFELAWWMIKNAAQESVIGSNARQVEELKMKTEEKALKTARYVTQTANKISKNAQNAVYSVGQIPERAVGHAKAAAIKQKDSFLRALINKLKSWFSSETTSPTSATTEGKSTDTGTGSNPQSVPNNFTDSTI